LHSVIIRFCDNMANIKIIDCGVKDYQSVLLMQENAFQNLLTGQGEDTVFIVEHPPVITLGARESANKLLKDADSIKQSGIDIFQIRRGGGTTAHNPGQLVVYPIINLKKNNLGVSDFVHKLEAIGIELLKELGVNCSVKKGFPGLWIADKTSHLNFLNSVNPCKSVSEINSVNPRLKIASIGVQIKKWITFHGMAININNDLSIFDLIVPCGLDNVKMTNAQIELGQKIDIKTVKNTLKTILLKHFTG
jgi:lipoyl(octanoyl) transferase